LISDIPADVIAIATLEFSIPSKISGSLSTKSPLLSYTVNAAPAETFSLKNAVAPLYFPLTWTGTVKVIGSLSVMWENVWISYSW